MIKKFAGLIWDILLAQEGKQKGVFLSLEYMRDGNYYIKVSIDKFKKRRECSYKINLKWTKKQIAEKVKEIMEIAIRTKNASWETLNAVDTLKGIGSAL